MQICLHPPIKAPVPPGVQHSETPAPVPSLSPSARAVHACRLVRTGGPVLAAFLIGACGMVLGAVAGCALLGQLLGAGWAGAPQQASAVAASLCSSYVGGSINFVAVSQVWTSMGCGCEGISALGLQVMCS